MCERSTSLQVPAEDSSPTLFSDMNQFARSSGTHTVAKSLERGLPKDGSLICTCGRETLGCSMHPSGKAEWIASMRDSLASLTPLLESAKDTLTIETSGRKSSESLGRFNQDGFFLKMCRELFQTDLSEPSSVTWPASGMMRDGRVWELTRLVPRTEGNDGGVWPTPDANMGTRGGQNPGRINPERTFTLNDAIRMWPTPNTQDAKGAGSLKSRMEGRQMMLHQAVKIWPTPRASMSHGAGEHGQGGKDLQTTVGGKLNPMWVEWLMAWPLGWTVSRLWVMGKSRFRRPLHGGS